MRTAEIKIFSIDELSKEAREKAIEKERYSEHRDYLMFFKEDVEEQLKEAFWQDVTLQYSLSCCQGDGLSFAGTLDLKAFLDNMYSVKLATFKKKALCEYIYSVHSTGNKGRYCYAHEGQIEYTENYQDSIERKHIEKLWQAVLKEIVSYYMSLCKKFENQGYEKIDHENSDEYIIEDFRANEIEFREDGSLWRD